MESSLYVDKGSQLHRLDPRAKLFGLIGVFVLALVFNHPGYLAGVMALVLAAGTMGRSLGNVKRTIKLLVILFAVSTVLWTVFVHGPTVIFRLGPIYGTRESLLYGIGMGLRLTSMIIAGLVFLSTTMVEEFTLGLRRLGVPFAISFALSTAFRLVPTLVGTASTVAEAQKARALDLESGGLITRTRKHLPLLLPILGYAIRSTDLLAMALESKGFGARAHRTSYLELKMKAADYFLLLASVALIAVCFWLRLQGYGVVLDRI